jgi:Flp pilus assembly protein TadD
MLLEALRRGSPRQKSFLSPRLLATAVVAAVVVVPVAGCKTTGPETTGSIGAPATPTSETDWRRLRDYWGQRYHANSGDAEAAIAYARALRALEQRAQAVAVLQEASIRNPHNMKLLGAYGRALADAGQYAQALSALDRAHTPDNPDWRILNAQGAVLDQMGRHAEAQRHYSAALKIAPNQPSVLSNLGLSYALQKNLKQAEAVLRRAVAQPAAKPKVRQNLALLVGLQGRFAEAERIAGADLPPQEAAANVAYLRQMLAHRNKWKQMSKQPYVPSPDTRS